MVRVDTSSADVAAYAELYNRSQDRYIVVIRYIDGPAEWLARGESDADVLIGPALASGELAGRLRSLDRLFRSKLLHAAAFFPGLLIAGQAEGAQTTLPLSFRIPVVVVRAGAEVLPSFAVTPKDLVEFNPSSLSWDSELIYRAAVLYGADFRLLPDGRIGLEQVAIDRAVEQARELLVSDEGSDLDIARPFVQMLLDEQIDFFVTDLQRFLEIPQEQRDTLGIRWLGSDEMLQPSEDLTYVAIRAGARNSRGAQSFLLWLFDPATQTLLLDISVGGHSTKFGIAGGLPALIDVARDEVPARYPFLIGLVPKAVVLAVPSVLSADWESLKEAVVMPWLRAALRDPEQATLAQEINNWRNHHRSLTRKRTASRLPAQ